MSRTVLRCGGRYRYRIMKLITGTWGLYRFDRIFRSWTILGSYPTWERAIQELDIHYYDASRTPSDRF